LQHLILAITFSDVLHNSRHAPNRVLVIALVLGGDQYPAHRAINAAYAALEVPALILERRTDQLVSRTTGKYLHLLVNICNDTGWISSHQRVNVGFHESARVELLVTQPLVEQLLFFFDLLALTDVSK
jgi:hypothetical protein